MSRVGGIHHVTAIAGDPQTNLDFYTGTLGLRLVKRSVNQDAPGTYHLFYADGEGRPGTDLTFFPHEGGAPGRDGTGLADEVAFQVPPGSLDWWRDHLAKAGPVVAEEERFGETALTFEDPHGLALAIVGSEQALDRPFTPWDASPVPEDHQLRGFRSVRVLEQDAGPTADAAEEVLGLERIAEDGDRVRFAGRDRWSGCLDLRETPERGPGRLGLGTVHHVAWRVADGDEQLAVRERVLDHGLRPTEVIDRFWFESVYFREPGGVLFELATEGPGFTADEALEHLGEELVLPPWLEPRRDEIERALTPLELPRAVAADGGTG